ncbi:MAG: hypothetical protein ACPG4Z_04880 [Chitinophagales bacterium]
MIVETILEIVKYTLPALVVGITVYMLLDRHFKKEEKIKLYQLKADSKKEALPLKLQAYERIALLIHRISPENMLPRIQNPSMTAAQLRQLAIQSIKQEVEHNITQQIYLNAVVWNGVQAYKNDLTVVFNREFAKLEKGATAFDLSKAVLEYYMQNEEVINGQRVMAVLNQDIKNMFV